MLLQTQCILSITLYTFGLGLLNKPEVVKSCSQIKMFNAKQSYGEDNSLHYRLPFFSVPFISTHCLLCPLRNQQPSSEQRDSFIIRILQVGRCIKLITSIKNKPCSKILLGQAVYLKHWLFVFLSNLCMCRIHQKLIISGAESCFNLQISQQIVEPEKTA